MWVLLEAPGKVCSRPRSQFLEAAGHPGRSAVCLSVSPVSAFLSPDILPPCVCVCVCVCLRLFFLFCKDTSRWIWGPLSPMCVLFCLTSRGGTSRTLCAFLSQLCPNPERRCWNDTARLTGKERRSKTDRGLHRVTHRLLAEAKKQHMLGLGTGSVSFYPPGFGSKCLCFSEHENKSRTEGRKKAGLFIRMTTPPPHQVTSGELI